MTRRRSLIALALFCLVGFARADEEKKEPPKPEVKGVSQIAVASGKKVTLTIFGENLAPVSVTTKPPLAVTLGETKDTDEETKKARNGATKQVSVEVTPPENCPPGVYEIMLVHAGDVKTSAKVAVVEPLPEVEVKRPNATFAQAMPLPLPAAAVTTTLQNDTPDLFRFDAKAGETFTVEVLAGGVGSPVDALVRVRDARRVPLALAAGYEKEDRHLTFRAPHDGTYYLEVSDGEGKGGPAYQYRLTLRQETTKSSAAEPRTAKTP
jgi:hypothetical protein